MVLAELFGLSIYKQSKNFLIMPSTCLDSRRGRPQVCQCKQIAPCRLRVSGNSNLSISTPPVHLFLISRCLPPWHSTHFCRRSRRHILQPPLWCLSAIFINYKLPMYAKIVNHEALNGLLQPVDVDERQDEHGVGAVAEFGYP